MEGWYKSNKFLYYGTQNSYLATTATLKAIRNSIRYRYHSVAPHSGEEKEKNRKVVVSKTPGGGRGEGRWQHPTSAVTTPIAPMTSTCTCVQTAPASPRAVLPTIQVRGESARSAGRKQSSNRGLRYGRDTRQECGHRPAGHHHLRPRGAAGRPRRGALPEPWNQVCGAIGIEFSDGRGFGALLKVLVTRSHFIELRSE